MNVNTRVLRRLLASRTDEIEKAVAGTGFLPRTVMGVATFLLDNEGNTDLFTAKQQEIFDRFIKPLLESTRR
ncbi:hypothetical protein Geob_2371 [Geotalea daltonii FRC-32]|uniref:Uncharacterized protein n=1 Tax=Geotalea daltonii (strain DSM 22248 / JCM 15807 / FRC-32) TaxID=316067 RepID=B9LZH2_GEODF|nr:MULTISPECIES: hypothetical protein [Geotalea]ACM20725.1 hypothetical protein Geob_2371 [Geotalea daltonii FRC-32]